VFEAKEHLDLLRFFKDQSAFFPNYPMKRKTTFSLKSQ